MDVLAMIFGWPGGTLIVGGGLGGIARALFLKTKIMDSLGSIMLGAIMGYYASPTFVPLVVQGLTTFHLAADPDKIPGLSAFATGAGAIAIFGAFYDWINERRKRLKAAQSPDPAASPPPKPGDNP